MKPPRGLYLRIEPVSIDGELFLDFRYYQRTPDGLVRTKHGVLVEGKLHARMITALQKLHQIMSSQAARGALEMRID